MAFTGSAPFSAARSELKSSPLDIGIRDLAHRELVGEVWRGGDCCAMAVKRPKPAFRPRQERDGGKYDNGNAEVERHKPGADQTHVMVERQPTDADVVGADRECLADGANVGEQIRVG